MPDINEKTRTTQQNKSLHLYYTQLAQALNESGNDMRKTIRQDIQISWTAHSIKEYVWRPVMQAMFGNKSTTQMTTKDIDRIYDVINREIGQRTGVSIPWPSMESLMQEES